MEDGATTHGCAEILTLHCTRYYHLRLARAQCYFVVEQVGLQRLAFQNVGCSIRACQAVAELVQNSGELRALHLYNNMSDNEGAIAIAQVRSPVLIHSDAQLPPLPALSMPVVQVGATGLQAYVLICHVLHGHECCSSAVFSLLWVLLFLAC